MNSLHAQRSSLSTTLDISFTFYTTLMDNTFLYYKCSMVGVKVILPYLPTNMLLLRPLLSLGRVLPNLNPTYLPSDPSYFLLLSAKRGLLSQTPEASPSCYTLGPTFIDNLQAKQIPYLIFLPKHLNSQPFARHCYFVQN